MADLFVSYSRKDKEFVRRLHDRLTQAGYDVWFDVEDIPPAVNFLNEILPAIEAADKFLFVISPDSVASEYCSAEIAHAIKHNKPLIPIVCRMVAASELDKHLSPINWIDFQMAEFALSFEKLISLFVPIKKLQLTIGDFWSAPSNGTRKTATSVFC